MTKRSRQFGIRCAGGMATIIGKYNLLGIDRIPKVLQLIVDCVDDNINVEERQGHRVAALVAAPSPE
jgi:hypothetical protein